MSSRYVDAGMGGFKQPPPITNEERVIAVLADILDVRTETITVESNLSELSVDSIDFQELIMEVEDDFDIDISFESEEKVIFE